MKTTIRFFARLLIVLALSPRAVTADEPPTTGRVLVLDNERTLEGEVERVGEQYRVRRSVGETWVPGERVLRLCQTREQAYEFLRSRANLVDADERLRLANWCYLHGLREQALAEVTAAVELRPEHAESRRLLRNLQRHATAALPSERDIERREAGPPAVSSPVELTTESLSLFVTKVQPILMNACASCHAGGDKQTGFRLTRAFEFNTAHRRTLQANLTAVLAQINVDTPAASPLLLKAVSVHGEMAQPALKGRQSAAYKTLEEWVRVTLDGNPQLRYRAPTATVATALESPEQSVGSFSKEQGQTAAPESNKTDPFDPDAFNRQVHPKQAEEKKQ